MRCGRGVVALAGMVPVAMLVASARPATAQPHGPLAGIDSLAAAVVVSLGRDADDLDAEALQARLQTVLELELRVPGVPVGSSRPGRPAFSTEVVVLGTGDGAVAYAFLAGLQEEAHPRRTVSRLSARVVSRRFDDFPAIAEALVDLPHGESILWREPLAVGYVGRNNFQDAIEREVREAAQAFANAFLEANPRR